MKITGIQAQNYQRLTNVNIPVRAPIVLLAGENEQGKTSLADGVYHAMCGVARRVALKKDFKDLVHDGAKKGQVIVSVVPSDGEPEDGMFMVTVPADKRTVQGVDEHPLMPYLLDAKRFPAMKPDERRTLLFGITGTRISAKTILEKLKEKGANTDKTTAIGATMLAGFAAAHTEAKAKASEARGAWKEVTGEVYGSKKAEDWKAARPAFDPAEIERLEANVKTADEKVAALQREAGANDAKHKAQQQRQERRKALVDLVDQIPRREAKLATDQGLVDEWTAKVAQTEQDAGSGPKAVALACPHCSALVEMQGGKLVQHDPSKGGDPKAIALLPSQRQTLAQVTSTRDKAKTALQEVVDAKAKLAELDAQDEAEKVDEADAALTAAALRTAQQTAQQVRAALDVQKDARAEAAQADTKTTKAAKHHKDACEWDQIAEWLAPDGIQAELLKNAMDPFNERLAHTATLTGWNKVEIDGDMTIRIAGRPYALCSASAKWRAEAAITEAIAHVSKVKTFLLDEAEILIGPNRLAFLKWMHHIAAAGEIDTAIVIGSFKDKPQCPPTYQVEWVHDGKAGVTDAELREREAA